MGCHHAILCASMRYSSRTNPSTLAAAPRVLEWFKSRHQVGKARVRLPADVSVLFLFLKYLISVVGERGHMGSRKD